MKNFFLFLLGLIIGAAAVYFYCCQDDGDLVTLPPQGLITPAEAKVLDQAFDTRHQLISDSIVKRPDNRSSWYSLVDMRQYLDYAESEAKDLGYTMDGIRVYLGAYPDVKGEVGYTTMFFIPTGTINTTNSESSMFNFYMQGGSGDITGGSGFNGGEPGHPPSSNYPQ